MTDITGIAKAFTDFYYSTFDRDRQELANLYRPSSMLTFEGTPVMGTSDIVNKLVSLPFQKVQHRVSTLDAQPSSTNNTLIVAVTGLLLIDEEMNPQLFTQTFQLVPEGSSYYVLNDIFRLVYG
ncbi:hypothetical protein BDB01DRAFT_773377 [Pilobolus umbonatus]|nr:hypothetical protein BDB01DRAFT_773377 [Pilobolus umbonatus]